VQAGVAGALRNLSVTEANRKAIIKCGGMEALVLASQIHAENEKLQSEVAGAPRTLLCRTLPSPSPSPSPGPSPGPSHSANLALILTWH
jgi:hypothetical protein